jgi:hypothetical protein
VSAPSSNLCGDHHTHEGVGLSPDAHHLNALQRIDYSFNLFGINFNTTHIDGAPVSAEKDKAIASLNHSIPRIDQAVGVARESLLAIIFGSTADQLTHNHESRRQQYGLANRASGPYLAARRRHRVASEVARWRGARHCLEIAGLQYRAQHSDQSNLRRRYAFGRTTSKVSVEQGRKRVRRGVRRPMAEWDVLIEDHHEAYITWDEFEKNQRVIANNATGKGSATVKGAVRRGELLLAGLLRCGHCGRKLHVSYSGKLGRYNCYGARTNHGTEHCISISGLSIDAAVGTEVLRILKPLGIDAAVKASRLRRARHRPHKGSLNFRFNRRATRPRMPVGSTTLSIPPIA